MAGHAAAIAPFNLSRLTRPLPVVAARYLGQTPLPANAPFLLTVHLPTQTAASDALNDIALELPPEITMTAPPVHIPAGNEIVWRLAGSRDGKYEVKVAAA